MSAVQAGKVTKRRGRSQDHVLESLEQQAATAEILHVMGNSPADLEPVFRTILSNASRLCQASVGAVFLFDGEVLTNVAHQNASPEFVQFLDRSDRRPSRETTTRRCALERRTVHTADLMNDPDYSPPEFQRRENVRAAMSVPMIRNGVLIGVITLWRHLATPFTDRQIALVQTFADQAVIAIENVRLFKEIREALEQQTATAEILRVMSGSPTDVQPVFEAIVRSGVRLFENAGVTVARPENGQVRLMAIAERDPERVRKWKERFPFPLTREYMHGKAILDCCMVDMPDVEQIDEKFAAGKRNFAASGYRAMTVVPMVRDGAAIGTISVVRDAPGPLSDKQIALLRTFADQAAIAVENVRLFNETREALAQQQALAEVLGAMSASIADTKLVFDRILDSCERLFQGHIVGLTLAGEDGLIRLGAYKGEHQERMQQVYPIPLARDSGSGQAILDQKVVHFPDVDGPGTPRHVIRGAQAAGFKSIIFVPMVDEGRSVGALWVARPRPVAFDDRATALLQTFGNQAVIAIRNSRLFNEIQEKSRQLEIASRHKSEFLANMSHELRTPLNAIIGFTRIVMRRSREQIETRQYENLEKILSSGQHLLALINSILDLAKVEAGRVEIQPAEIDLAPALEICMRTIEPLVKSAVTLTKEFDSTLPRMYVDEEKLRQIVINLLSNAAKFTARGSIRLQAHASNGAVALAVNDTGIGIAPDKLDTIFEEFAQAEASNARIYGGTGLGLTIARRLARLMGGEIVAESALGDGSKFTLKLPLRYHTPSV